MSKVAIFTSIAALLAPLPVQANDAPVMMPLPRAASFGEGRLEIAGPFDPRFTGCGETGPLERAAARLRRDVARQTGLPLDPQRGVAVTVSCGSSGLAADRGEGYRLLVDGEGVRIEADGPMGVVRAFATLRQLVGLAPGGIALPHGRIDDSPRFAWRGVLLDVARHFLSIETIKRQIDAMERMKLNVLHLHLSDDQGFRVESRRYPRLTAATGGQFYTQAEIRDLVAYAADRGVRVVPEFDVPGHSRALVEAYPEIGVLKQGPFGMAAALNPGRAETYRFIERLFAEMAGLFPDRYFHIGGDEVPHGIWDGDPAVEALRAREGLADARAVEGYFHRRVHAIVSRLGRTMIGWDEVAGSGLPRDTVVQPWRSSNATADVTADGYRAIVSSGYYLDLLMPAEFHYAKDPADPSAAGLAPDHAQALRRRSPRLAAIVTDPQIAFPRPPLTPLQEQLILGAEMSLWGELVTDELVDQRLWPRAAALAERFWSPRDVRDVADMYRRLAVVGDMLSVTGVADQANMTRMAARLAPGEAEPVETLLSVTGPVRNMAHDHRIMAALAGRTIVQPLNVLADAAPVDSLVARRFASDAASYAAGDKSLLPALRAQLAMWRDNDTRFVALAERHPALAEARPVSAQIAAVATAGMEAIDSIEAGSQPAPETRARWQGLLDALQAQEAASSRPFDFLQPQPPADLIVKLGPGLRSLVEAAQTGR